MPRSDWPTSWIRLDGGQRRTRDFYTVWREGRFRSHPRCSCTSTSVQAPGTWRRPLWCRCCWWRLRETGGSESRARCCCCCRPGNGGWKGGSVPAQGWGRGVLALLSGASCGGSGGSVESACQRILLSAAPVRSPPPPSPPLSSPSLDSLFNLPFALVSPVRGRSGGNGTGPAILQALLPMGGKNRVDRFSYKNTRC